MQTDAQKGKQPALKRSLATAFAETEEVSLYNGTRVWIPTGEQSAAEYDARAAWLGESDAQYPRLYGKKLRRERMRVALRLMHEIDGTEEGEISSQFETQEECFKLEDEAEVAAEVAAEAEAQSSLGAAADGLPLSSQTVDDPTETQTESDTEQEKKDSVVEVSSSEDEGNDIEAESDHASQESVIVVVWDDGFMLCSDHKDQAQPY